MSDLDNVYFRKWGGSGNYNDLGTWGPLVNLGPGSEPELVDGKRGVYLSYMTDDFPRQYRVRRWGGMSFGESRELTPKASPLWSDFFQDEGGRLHFVWAENSDDTLKRRFSTDGTSWSKVETLTPAGTRRTTTSRRRRRATAGAGRSGTTTGRGRCRRSSSARPAR